LSGDVDVVTGIECRAEHHRSDDEGLFGQHLLPARPVRIIGLQQQRVFTLAIERLLADVAIGVARSCTAVAGGEIDGLVL